MIRLEWTASSKILLRCILRYLQGRVRCVRTTFGFVRRVGKDKNRTKKSGYNGDIDALPSQ
jgi:hypothetical protein